MTALVSGRQVVRRFGTGAHEMTAVDEVDLEIQRGESVGVVGESGSGKTTLVRCLFHLIEPTSGTVMFDGHDLARLRRRELRALRSRMGFVFQNPVLALNPRMRVEDVVAEPLRLHTDLRGPDLTRRITEVLDDVGMAAAHLHRLPHQLSGGQCQRVGIARALATRPELLVLDEPTSALDVSVQAQILNLLLDLRAEHGLTYLMISHDLDVVRYLSERVAVMLLGRVVEEGPIGSVLSDPSHDYTRTLLDASPGRGRDVLMRDESTQEEVPQ